MKFNQFVSDVTTLIDMIDEMNSLNAIVFQLPRFRGQSNVEHSLQTTLERSGLDQEVHKYYQKVLRIKPRIESHASVNWTEPEDIVDFCRGNILAERYKSHLDLSSELPMLDYLAYLRHHGFPSPLLDWSMSPFIATYFAFRNANDRIQTEDGKVAVYCLVKSTSGGHFFSSEEPFISLIPESTRMSKRHYVQQSSYSICLDSIVLNKGDSNLNRYIFGSHSKVFDNESRVKGGQDVTIKYLLPLRDRSSILKSLNRMNINEYSLFGTEDALCAWLRDHPVDY